MIKNSRKAQSLSINTIIVAVIALVVLVVLIMIFTGKIRIFSTRLESCATRQGSCKSVCGNNEVFVPNAKCPEQGDQPSDNKCCVQILNT